MKNLKPITREEKYLHAIATGEAADITPVTGEEHFLAAIASGETPNREPKTRKEYFLNECANGTGGSGGGDIETAVLEVINTAEAAITLPIIHEGAIGAFHVVSSLTGSNAATVPLGSAGAVLIVDASEMYNITLNGDIEVLSSSTYKITGDCSITITSRS